jgi:hypothetical protein
MCAVWSDTSDLVGCHSDDLLRLVCQFSFGVSAGVRVLILRQEPDVDVRGAANCWVDVRGSASADSSRSTLDGDAPDNLRAELHGELAAILALGERAACGGKAGKTKLAGTGVSRSQLSVVAGTCNHLDLLLSG